MKKFYYFFIIVSMISCTSNTIYKKPKNLIPKDTMTLLLQDIYIANAAREFYNKNNEDYVDYMSLVYNKYKIDSLRFRESNIYYTSILEEYEKIMKQVVTNLDTLKKRATKKEVRTREVETLPKEKFENL